MNEGKKKDTTAKDRMRRYRANKEQEERELVRLAASARGMARVIHQLARDGDKLAAQCDQYDDAKAVADYASGLLTRHTVKLRIRKYRKGKEHHGELG